MDMGSINGKMVENMKVSIKWIKRMVMVYTYGQMGGFIQVSGWEENNMDLEFTKTLIIVFSSLI